MEASVRWIGDQPGRGEEGRRGRLTSAATLAVGVLLVALAAALLRGGLPPTRLDLPALAGAQEAPAPELTAFAADTLEASLTTGAGVTFEIVQTSTMTAREDGPLVPIPDPADPTKPLGEAPRYVVGTLIARGAAQPDGYWLELIHGPEPGSEAEYRLEAAQVSRQALVRDGTMYRNDGDGWHETDMLPGIGLDPITLAGLPALLDRSAEATEVELEPARPAPAEPAPLGPVTVAVDADVLAATLDGLTGPESPAVRALATRAQAPDLPGIIAPDLVDFTELLAPVELRFDEGGRLVGLTILARNTHLDVHDLVVETVITLRYPAGPAELPVPEPRYVEPSLDPAAAEEE